ncbi:MAG TPA: DUF1330 domain-containing protein [Thermoanaerobaculia bacterium]|nr:DUF1330 domain-containing protein [Thermoanaerobaculia bacterium]
MAAYCLFDNLEVVDAGKLEEYKNRVAPVVAQYGGRYVVLGGNVDLVEGDWRPAFPVMIEFPDLARARQWYASDEYRELKALRLSAVRSNAVFLEGL